MQTTFNFDIVLIIFGGLCISLFCLWGYLLILGPYLEKKKAMSDLLNFITRTDLTLGQKSQTFYNGILSDDDVKKALKRCGTSNDFHWGGYAVPGESGHFLKYTGKKDSI